MIPQRFEGRKGEIVDKLPFFLTTVPVTLIPICFFESVLISFQLSLDDTSSVAAATTGTPAIFSENVRLCVAFFGSALKMELLLLFGVLPFRRTICDVAQSKSIPWLYDWSWLFISCRNAH